MLIKGSPYSDNGTVNGDGKLHPKLIGTLANDVIYGYAGNDHLDGSFGADQMYGGANDDVYIVDNPNDKVFENLNEGTDTVRSFVSYTMPNNVEILYLQGAGNINGFGNNQNYTTLLGNSGSNYLRGGNGINVLNGMAGADTLEGMGVSDDSYIVDNPGDKIVDGQATGIETVLSTVSWDLRISYKRINPADPNDLRIALNDPGVEGLDHLTLTGAGHTNGIGNKLPNTIKGSSGNNTIDGLGGNDNLYGFGGSDNLYGSSGSDTLTGSNGALNERDVLTGGSEGDLFVLGDTNRVFYTGDGDGGYAVIKDFFYGQGDKIQMKGVENDYQWVEFAYSGVGSSSVNDTGIYKGGDLIAIVQDQNRTNGGFLPEYDVNFI
jgi:Ca2+-binding RTX toxin-like protein